MPQRHAKKPTHYTRGNDLMTLDEDWKTALFGRMDNPETGLAPMEECTGFATLEMQADLREEPTPVTPELFHEIDAAIRRMGLTRGRLLGTGNTAAVFETDDPRVVARIEAFSGKLESLPHPTCLSTLEREDLLQGRIRIKFLPRGLEIRGETEEETQTLRRQAASQILSRLYYDGLLGYTAEEAMQEYTAHEAWRQESKAARATGESPPPSPAPLPLHGTCHLRELDWTALMYLDDGTGQPLRDGQGNPIAFFSDQDNLITTSIQTPNKWFEWDLLPEHEVDSSRWKKQEEILQDIGSSYANPDHHILNTTSSPEKETGIL